MCDERVPEKGGQVSLVCLSWLYVTFALRANKFALWQRQGMERVKIQCQVHGKTREEACGKKGEGEGKSRCSRHVQRNKNESIFGAY